MKKNRPVINGARVSKFFGELIGSMYLLTVDVERDEYQEEKRGDGTKVYSVVLRLPFSIEKNAKDTFEEITMED